MRLTTDDLINEADLSNVEHNYLRKMLLTGVRGYLTQTLLFNGFPLNNTVWIKAALEPKEIGKLLFANVPTWTQLSEGSRLVSDGAKNTDIIPTGENTNANIKAIANKLALGTRYPELILAEKDNELILIEGHTRATAYVYANHKESVDVFIAKSPDINNWSFV
jgi:hypothetical protein